jgi:hypothetical protein
LYSDAPERVPSILPVSPLETPNLVSNDDTIVVASRALACSENPDGIVIPRCHGINRPTLEQHQRWASEPQRE